MEVEYGGGLGGMRKKLGVPKSNRHEASDPTRWAVADTLVILIDPSLLYSRVRSLLKITSRH